MDWTAAGVIVSGALALAAIVVQQVNRRTDRTEAQRAAADAGARADAAQAAADRSAAATERMAQAAEAQALALARASPEPQAAWTLEPWGGSVYILTNAGDADAYDVHVDTGDLRAVPMMGDGLDRERLEVGQGIRFATAVTFGTTDDTVTVTWADEPGGTERRSWSRPLPPKPPAASVHAPKGTIPTGADVFRRRQ